METDVKKIKSQSLIWFSGSRLGPDQHQCCIFNLITGSEMEAGFCTDLHHTDASADPEPLKEPEKRFQSHSVVQQSEGVAVDMEDRQATSGPVSSGVAF